MKGLVSRGAIRGGTAALIDQGMVSATNFLTGMALGRFAGKEEFGLYMLGLSAILIVTDLQTALVATPYMIHRPHLDGDPRRTYTGSTLVHQAGLVLAASLVALVAALVLVTGGGPEGLSRVLFALVMFGGFILFREYLRRLSFACLEPGAALALDAVVTALQLAGLGLLAWSDQLNAVLAFAVIGSAGAIGILGWMTARRSVFRIDSDRILPDLAHNWRLGRWVFASGLLWSLSMQCYPWIITAFHGTAAAGVWAACLGVVNLANPVMLGIQNYLGPNIATAYARTGGHGAGRHIAKASVLFAAMIVPFTLLAIAAGGVLVVLVYGDQYAGNGAVVAILGVNLLVMALSFPVSRALFAARRADLDCAVNGIALLFLVAAGFWLVRTYGPAGAAVGLAGTNILSTLVRTGVLVRLMRSHDESAAI